MKKKEINFKKLKLEKSTMIKFAMSNVYGGNDDDTTTDPNGPTCLASKTASCVTALTKTSNTLVTYVNCISIAGYTCRP